MDPQVPQQPEPAPQPVPAPAAGAYESNPFRPLVAVLGKTLTLNGISALQLGIVAVVVGVVGYFLGLLVAGLLGGLLHSVIISVVLVIAVVLALLYFVLTVTAAVIKLIEDSSQGTAGGWRSYLSAGRPYALRLLGLGILMDLGIALAFVLLVIPGFYVMGRWMLAPLVMVQENLGIRAALGRSWALTKGHIWEVLGSLMAGALLGSNGFLAPLVLPSALIGRYEQLRDLESGKVSKPKLHWLNWFMVLIIPVFFGGIIALGVLQGISDAQKNQQQQQLDQFYQQIQTQSDSGSLQSQ